MLVTFKNLEILLLNKLVYNRLGIMMYKYSNNLLPPAINDVYVSNNDFHKYSTRQNIYFMLTRVTSMLMQRALETQVFVYGMLYSPKLM